MGVTWLKPSDVSPVSPSGVAVSVRALIASIAIACVMAPGIAPAGAEGSRAAPSSSPPPRSSFAMASDRNKDIVLFGGYDGDLYNLLGDTWTWNGTTWTERQSSSAPSPRFGHGMAYDAARRQTLLFGGTNANRYFDDTWTWDGTAWTKQHPAVSPPGGAAFAMVYDAAIRQVLVFMGEGLSAVPWAWDGRNWRQLSASTLPAWREREGFAYDGAGHQTLMFGGESCVEYCILYDQTWTWNGADWTQQAPTTNPGQISFTSMAYDVTRRRVVLFGGQLKGLCCFGDTWNWDGRSWQKMSPQDAPSPREGMAMAWDSARRQVVLFGGRDYPEHYWNDTWTWDGIDWTQH
jgi:hypothetical protein